MTMKDVKWIINRLKAMKAQEVIWRLQERQLQKKEFKTIYSQNKPVTEIPLSEELSKLCIDINKLSVNWDNKIWNSFDELDLFGLFDYSKYKLKWNAGFQTENEWPEEPFSKMLNISQRVDIGDIRTNWEINRHYQFSALAKSYYCTRDEQYFTELKKLFNNWNEHNLFLHGVEWTSAMELAIRVNSWVYMLGFLTKTECEDEIIEKINHGIIVMTDYIFKHRSRYSSANNHLIVEMYAVAIVGILTDHSPWKCEAINLLTEELPKQNYSDGVNKEMSLHYQSFVMEAYGLLCLLMIKNKIEIPEIWKTYLASMSKFLVDSIYRSGSIIEFGDSDEGKILDLNGKIENYYQYILNLMSCILDMKYTDSDWHENLYWIVPTQLRSEKKKYVPALVSCRRKGGYTFIRSNDRRILIGIDHAALGFGSIAAHGHADALSFQMFVDGEPLFVDPGTYLYHCYLNKRNAFRKTENHNTITINGKDQSEMLGAFLWGKRANCKLISFENTSDKVTLAAEHDGYRPIIHRRTFEFDRKREFCIKDQLSADCDYTLTFMLAPNAKTKIESNSVSISVGVCICKIEFESKEKFEIYTRDAEFSERYGVKKGTTAVSVKSHGKVMKSKITVWENVHEYSCN